MAENIANVSVNVTSNAATALPRDVTQGYNAAQKALNARPLKVNVDTKGAKGLNDIHLALGRISKSGLEFERSIQAATSRTAAFAITAGALVGVERAFSALVKSSIDVEQQLTKIKVIAGSTTKDFNDFSRGIFDVARQTSESFSNASKAALEFARAGNSLEETLKRTQSALTLVKISGVDISTAIESITSTLNTFGNELSDSADLVAKLTNVDANFAVSANDLAQALSAVGNSAAENKVELNDLLGAVTAVAARTGQSGNVIGNAFKAIFTRVSRSENVELLNELGVATEDVAGKSRSAIDILRDLSKAYVNLGDSQRKQVAEQIAGVFQIGRFQALMRDLSSSFSVTSAASEEAANSFGSANKRLEELNQTTASLLQQSATNLTEFASSFGKLTFESPLKNFLSGFTADDSILQGINDTLARIADPERTKGIGERLGKGILEGVGNFISGPGVVFLAGVLKSALGAAFGFLNDAAKNLLGINRAIQQQVTLQQQVNAALGAASAEDLARINNAKTLNQQIEYTVQLLNKQKAASANINIIAGLQNRGVTAGANSPDTRRFRAGGYIPFNTRRADEGYFPVGEEMSAIKSSPDYAGNRDAKPQILKDFSIEGRKQNIVVNSAEKVVPTKAIYKGYNGPDQYSILNPRQQKVLGFNMGYYPKRIPNLAELLKLSSGLTLDPKKQYVFRSTQVAPGRYSAISQNERGLSRTTGFETITDKDLVELLKVKASSIPLIKVIDPTRVLNRVFLDSPRYAKLKNKFFVTQAKEFKGDKFEETQQAKGFAKSVNLDRFSFKTGENAIKSVDSLEGELGNKYFIKLKTGKGGDGNVHTSQQINPWIRYVAEVGEKKALEAEGGKDFVPIVKKILKNPSKYFAQKAIEDYGEEYRVPMVGTRRGSVPLGIFNRNDFNTFASGEEIVESLSKSIKTMGTGKEKQKTLSVAQSTINSLPVNKRQGVVFGLDVTRKGPIELNPTDDKGLSGTLDNPILRGRTAKTLLGVTEDKVKTATNIGLKILNYQGSEETRKSRFKQFEKALNNLKKDDEIAFFKIASNLVKAGFGLKAGRRKKVLFGDEASNYFSLRGFAGGYLPDKKYYAGGFSAGIRDAIGRESLSVSPSQIYVANVNTPKYSGPVVANTRDEPTGASLIDAVNTKLSKGFIPNLAVQSNLANPQQRIDPSIIQRSRFDFNQTVAQMTAQLSEEINKIGLTKLLFGKGDKELLTDIAKKQRNSVALSFGAKFDVEAFQQARENVRPQLQSRKDSLGASRGLIGAIGLPLAAGLAESLTEGTRFARTGRIAGGALQGAGLGASFGSFFGLPGLAIGTGLGTAAGIGGSLLGERSSKIEEDAQKRQRELEKITKSIESASSLISLEAQREDLRKQGASRSVLGAQDDRIREARSNVGADLLKKFNQINDSVSDFDERISQKIAVTSAAADDAKRQERINNADRIKEEANVPGFRDFGRVGLQLLTPAFGKAIGDSLLRRPSTQFNTDQRQVIGQGVLAGANFSSISTEEIKKLRDSIEALPGSGFGPSGITAKQQEASIQRILTALPQDQRAGARQQLQGIGPNDFKGILLPVFNNLVEASKQNDTDQKEQLANLKTSNEILRQIAQASNQGKLEQFGRVQARESLIFDRTSQLNTNAPFMTDLAKALEENNIALQKQTDEVVNAQEQGFKDFVDAISKAIPKDKLGKLADEISNLKQSTPDTINDDLKTLIDRLRNNVGDQGGEVETVIRVLQNDFNTQNSILDATLQEAKRQGGLTAESLRTLNKIATNSAAFGGLRGLLEGNRIPGGTGRDLNSGSLLRRAIRELPSAGIIGGEERGKQERAAQTEAAKAMLSAAEKLKAAGFDETFANKLVDPKVIEKGNTINQQKALFDVAGDLIKSSPFFDQIKQQKSFENVEREAVKRNDFDFIVSQIESVKSNLPQNQEDQRELIRKLEVIADKFREIPQISKAQVDREFKREELTPPRARTSQTGTTLPSQFQQQPSLNLNTAFTGIQNTNTAINTTLNTLNTTIQGLVENVAKLVVSTTADAGTAENPFASITITAVGGDSEQTKQILAKITDGLNSLNYKVNAISKATKTTIPPTTNNPFSNINNSSITL